MTRLDRLGRSLAELLETVGELVFHVFGAIAHFERRLVEAGMTPGKAARQLGIGRSTAYRLVRDGGIPDS